MKPPLSALSASPPAPPAGVAVSAELAPPLSPPPPVLLRNVRDTTLHGPKGAPSASRLSLPPAPVAAAAAKATISGTPSSNIHEPAPLMPEEGREDNVDKDVPGDARSAAPAAPGRDLPPSADQPVVAEEKAAPIPA